jgi:hypothetical protein
VAVWIAVLRTVLAMRAPARAPVDVPRPVAAPALITG